MNGAEIRERRKKLQLTQDGLAESLGMSKNTIARWERDELAPSPMLDLALKYLEMNAGSGKGKRKGITKI